MAQQLINGKQQFVDGNGNPLAGGSVAFYAPGTLNPVNTWQDQGLTILNANPVVLDANGMASIWGADTTLYREVVSSAAGVQIWDQVIGLVGAYGVPHGKQIFTSSGTFTPPSGVTSGWVSGCGGGAGGGAGASNNRTYASPAAGSGGAGGGAGQSVIKQPVTWGTSPVAVTIGAAGTGGASTSDPGTPSVGPSNGGTTSFGSFIALAGGIAGANGSNGAAPGGGLHGSGAIGAQDGCDAQAGVAGTGNGGSGGSSPFGTGGGGSRAGGSNVAWSPSAAYGFGAGGGGGGGQEDGGTVYAGSTGGNGTPGIIIVEW